MREGRWKGVKKKDERRKSGGQWEGKRVEGGERIEAGRGWKKKRSRSSEEQERGEDDKR